MTLNINYGTSVISLPGGIREHLENAGAVEIKVLIALADSPELCKNIDSTENCAALADICGCGEDEINGAVAFWRGAGVLVADGQKSRKATKKATAEKPVEAKSAPKATEAAPPKPLSRKDELPHYTTDELTALLEERKEAKDYIDECQRIWGKMFNTHEINIILGLVDYLGLDWEYVLTLLMYVKKNQDEKGVKKSLHYVEKMAFSLYDENVFDIGSLNAKLQSMDLLAQSESRLRAMFGMGERALTPKEKKCFSTWLYEYKFDLEIIRLAYDITVDAKGKPSIAYMNSVLANWNAEGHATLDDIKAAQEKFKAEQNPVSKKKNGKESDGSFETDDFFKAAVRRSFGDDFEG
ncbi:MAG: DnaD domain protein [Ruminococcaceae bacterium]|nr:DnaD domain protein [Oscillospiraceae bacterium]